MIGRKEEQNILLKSQLNKESEFIAIIGRRRVGKTYLVEQFFGTDLSFQMSGQKDFTNKEHLKIFSDKLKTSFPDIKMPHKNTNWLNAMNNLIHSLKNQGGKNVVFIDELPWLSKPKSGFIAALAYFWNEWARKNGTILIVCGSAASWMLSNIIKEKGSLYNRITKVIKVQPFTLKETKDYFESKDIYFNTEQLISLYMVMGGIPHYLKEVEKGKSAVQNIQQICFSQNGLLKNEFGNLYDALFNNSNDHKLIIEALYTSKKGLTKLQIAAASKLKPNGAFYEKIEELTECGFLVELNDLSGKPKNNTFRLIDEYSLFYYNFIKGVKQTSEDYWYTIYETPKYHSWSGYAFENICFRHLDKIKTALKIDGIRTTASSFYSKSTEEDPGAQIDLLLDRADNCLNLIECKYYKSDFYLNKTEADKIKRRRAVFLNYSKTKKQILITLLSPSQLIMGKESLGLIDHAFSGDIFID